MPPYLRLEDEARNLQVLAALSSSLCHLIISDVIMVVGTKL